MHLSKILSVAKLFFSQPGIPFSHTAALIHQLTKKSMPVHNRHCDIAQAQDLVSTSTTTSYAPLLRKYFLTDGFIKMAPIAFKTVINGFTI